MTRYEHLMNGNAMRRWDDILRASSQDYSVTHATTVSTNDPSASAYQDALAGFVDGVEVNPKESK